MGFVVDSAEAGGTEMDAGGDQGPKEADDDDVNRTTSTLEAAF